MGVAYVLIGAIGGFLGFAGAFVFGVPFWTAMLLYPTGGAFLIVLAALWQNARFWSNPATDQDVQGADVSGRAGSERIA